MHAILTTTHMHRRHVTESLNTSPAFAERNRLSLALSSYNARLAAPLTEDDADALLATATLVNAISFATVSTTDPSASWPMVTSPHDLQWLAIQQGPGLVMANSGRWMAQSLFASSFPDFERDSEPPNPNAGYIHPTRIPTAMFVVCGITLGTIADDNPYLNCLELLEPLLSLTPSTANMAKFLPFIGSIRPAFLDLLKQRDHSALLILSWWYALLCPLEQWWLCTRSRTECAAICMYLHQCASATVKELLAFPATACGLSME